MPKPVSWTPDSFPGTPLREADIPEGRVLSVEAHPNVRYAWDAGIAIGRYLAALKEGRILGSRCDTCQRTVVPPRIVCEECFRPMASWAYVGDTGTVNTFSVSHLAWDAGRIEVPELPAVIELDGASPGVGILHKLGEVDPKAVHTGLRVQAVWKPRRERRGAITDIRYFKPV